MNKINKNKLFILIVGSTFIGLFLMYIMAFNFSVNKNFLVSHSYKNFLLKHTKSPRLIIESGSNSFHAINTTMLEKELGMLTINLADNASYPLQYKLLRVKKYANSGDIVLLALEWEHYSYYILPKVFLNNIFDKLNFYYNNLSWINRVKLILKTPFRSFVEHQLYKNDLLLKESDAAQYQYEYKQLVSYEKRFLALDRGSSKPEDTPAVIGKIESEFCNKYILINQLKHGFFISPTFKKNIKIIKDIQKKGVRVFFIWPTVAGDNCYGNEIKNKLIAFSNKVKSYVIKNKIPFISKVEDSNFKANYILNTYYHVIPKARDIRTKRLITDIKRSKIMGWLKDTNSYSLDIKSSEIQKDIYKHLEAIKEGEELKLGTKNLKRNVFLKEGWFFHDKEKVWSQGRRSTIEIKLNNSLIGKALYFIIESSYHNINDHSKTRILVNGHLLGKYILNGKNKINIPHYLTKQKEGKLKIEFYYGNVKSPFELGNGLDRREFKLWVRSLMFLIIK
ncbi:MAG: hypothetical protein KAU26_06745 [Methylococcales bacterium]|nr:hypothetical protein [Methylococcales bacterium]